MVRNDQVEDVELIEKIVISPGPCTPKEAGISNDVVSHFAGRVPILGVCLGHQCIGYTYGGTVDRAGEIMHGKTSLIHHDGKGLFRGLPNPFEAIRYHSLAIYREDLPEELEVTAWTDKGLIMGVRHKEHQVEGRTVPPGVHYDRRWERPAEELPQLLRRKMIQEAISSVVSGQSLSVEEASQVMEEIMTGEATPAQFGAFVTAMRLKGETPDEIAGMARVMREKALRVQSDGDLVDTCGTGGDGSHTINVSTIAAFVTAGAGLKVAKHGNRAITSACGSADVMEAAGVKVDLGPEGVERCIRDVGIGFMFAPTFHPAMRYAGPPRREIGIRTVFNILGPLTNPAGARSQVLGVADGSLGEKMAMVLLRLGCRHALVVHGEDGLDEISIAAPSQIWELKDGNIYNFAVTPEDLGLSRASASDVQGQSIEDNLAAMNGVLSGERGPARDIVLLNASAALAAGNAVDNLKQGIMAASESIDSGKAMGKLRALAELSQKLT